MLTRRRTTPFRVPDYVSFFDCSTNKPLCQMTNQVNSSHSLASEQKFSDRRFGVIIQPGGPGKEV